MIGTKHLVFLSVIIIQSVDAQETHFKYILKEPYTDVTFSYKRPGSKKIEQFSPDIFSDEKEWSALIQYKGSKGPLVIHQIDATPLPYSKKGLAAAKSYMVTQDDIAAIKKGTKRFVIEADPLSRSLIIYSQKREKEPEHAEMEYKKGGNGG